MTTLTAFRTSNTQTAAVLGAMAALLIGIAMVPAASAAPIDETPSLVVQYDPQNLATDSGARAVYAKIASAARQVCPGDSSRDLRAIFDARKCRQEAIARAVNQIHQPRLVEIAARHGKKG